MNLSLILFIFGLTFHFTTDWEPHFLTATGWVLGLLTQIPVSIERKELKFRTRGPWGEDPFSPLYFFLY